MILLICLVDFSVSSQAVNGVAWMGKGSEKDGMTPGTISSPTIPRYYYEARLSRMITTLPV